VAAELAAEGGLDTEVPAEVDLEALDHLSVCKQELFINIRTLFSWSSLCVTF
jgi:hypothetical protein